jgi:hypothetical protein
LWRTSLLFANGVVSATLHFTNTKLHIKGYDFRGFPYLKIQGEGLRGVEADLPRDGWRHDLGAASFNFADTAILCGAEHPARLREKAGAVYYTPFDRIVNPQKPDAPADLWEPGFARTVRFQFSLSEAPPAVARYVVPAWWYGVCGEPWAGGLLPVSGRGLSSALATGGQMGAGPHPGWLSSLYMTGVSMVSLVEALEAERETGEEPEGIQAALERLHRHYMRDDVEMWPVSFGRGTQAGWQSGNAAALSSLVVSVYAAMGRRRGFDQPMIREGFAKLRHFSENPVIAGRTGDRLVHPWSHDALMLDARVAEDGLGVDLAPAFGPATLPWPARQTVDTPWGTLAIDAVESDGGVSLTFAAPADFRVRIVMSGRTIEVRSRGKTRC